MNSAYDKTTLTDAEVFVNFYAHTKSLLIQIFPMGWDKRKETNNKEYEVNLEAKEWLKFKTRDEIINALTFFFLGKTFFDITFLIYIRLYIIRKRNI